jgi:hypothetical protein
MGRKKPPETEAQRLERIKRIEEQMAKWLAHMRAELKKRREG